MYFFLFFSPISQLQFAFESIIFTYDQHSILKTILRICAQCKVIMPLYACECVRSRSVCKANWILSEKTDTDMQVCAVRYQMLTA